MNAEISKSDLAGMTLYAQKTVDDKTKHGVNTNDSLPLIKFVNSTIKQFTGTFIHLEMSDSWIPVDTMDIVSPIFVMRSSIAEIINCSFHGIQHKKDLGSFGNAFDTAIIFDVEDNSAIKITECVFENVQIDMGYDVSAALYAVYSQVEIHNSIFTRNKARFAVVLGLVSNMTVVDSVFSHNTGQQGASINVQVNSSLEVHNSTFIHNNAKFSSIRAGPQISVYVTDCVFANNTGQQGASINVQVNSSLEIYNSTFTHNNATHGSGICASFQTSVYVTDCVFANNTGQQAASIDVQQNCTLEVHNSTFTHNIANSGAGISAAGQTLVYVTGSIFTENRAAQFAGALVATQISAVNITSSVFLRNTAAFQGGALNVQQNSSGYIAHSVFNENSADGGGALVAFDIASMHIKASTFNGNSARFGGGVLGTQADVNVSLSDSKFNNNRANSDGGVIWATVNTNVVLIRSNLSENTAQRGAAIFILKSSLTIIETNFSDYSFNIIYMDFGQASMHTTMFINNSLTNVEIVKAVEKSNILFNDVIFLDNNAYGIILSSPMTPVTLYFCKFIGNIVTGKGIIQTENALLVINQSLIHNNSIHGSPGIAFDGAIITSCVFTHNTIVDYGLIQHVQSAVGSLQVTQSSFISNNGDVIVVDRTVDVVLNVCNFTGNNGASGTLYIVNDGATLRTSNTTIIAPYEGNKVAVYFVGNIKQITMTDYLTYDTCLISGNTTLNSSSTDTFLQEAVDSGLVVIHRQSFKYTVTQEETVFASGKCNFTALATICIIHASLKETQV